MFCHQNVKLNFKKLMH